MIQQEIILKILKRFIRWQESSVVSFQFSVRRKTNWQAYPHDSKLFSSIFGKRTGTSNLMNRQDLILKILNPFIRLPERAGSAKTKPNEANDVKQIGMSEMHEKFRKRSQGAYVSFYQKFTTKKWPIFGKNECFPAMNCRLPSLDPRQPRGDSARGRARARARALYPLTFIPAKAGIHGLSGALETPSARGMAILDMVWWARNCLGKRQLRPVGVSSTIAPRLQARKERQWRP